jgi:hypothetical protein
MLEFAITGTDAAQAAEALETILTQDTDLRPSRRMVQIAQDEREKSLNPMTVAIATLILAIPPAILASIDLEDHIAKRPKAEAVIDRANQIIINGNVSITVTVNGQGVPVPLQSLTPDQLIELARKGASVGQPAK